APKANGVDQRRVRGLVVKQQRFVGYECRYPRQIGLIASRKNNCILFAFEARDSIFEQSMDFSRTIQDHWPRHAHTISLDGLTNFGFDGGVIGKSKVIVRTEHQHVALLVGDAIVDLHATVNGRSDLPMIEEPARFIHWAVSRSER